MKEHDFTRSQCTCLLCEEIFSEKRFPVLLLFLLSLRVPFCLPDLG